MMTEPVDPEQQFVISLIREQARNELLSILSEKETVALGDSFIPMFSMDQVLMTPPVLGLMQEGSQLQSDEEKQQPEMINSKKTLLRRSDTLRSNSSILLHYD